MPPPEAPFPPLPLRARGVMELLDASVKLYRQYFGVLLSWSALTILSSVLLSLVPLVSSVAGLFIAPIMPGVGACCLAAAVRGQRVAFKQCWEFTKPRFWSMMGMLLLAYLCLVVPLIPFAVLLGIGVALASSDTSSALIFMLLGFAVLLVVAPYAIAWTSLVPVVVCFEEDKRNTQALGRAFQMLRGNWGRIIGVLILIGLGTLSLLAILGGSTALLVAGGNLASALSDLNSSRAIGVFAAFGVSGVLIYILATPLYSLCAGLFYLDVRTRQEALDLEWAAHTAQPAPSENTPYAVAPQDLAPSQGFVSGVQPSPGFVHAPPMTTPVVIPPTAATSPAAPNADTVTCAQCGAQSTAGQRFCMSCGAQLPTSNAMGA